MIGELLKHRLVVLILAIVLLAVVAVLLFEDVSVRGELEGEVEHVPGEIEGEGRE